jgi:hypothetical protein
VIVRVSGVEENGNLLVGVPLYPGQSVALKSRPPVVLIAHIESGIMRYLIRRYEEREGEGGRWREGEKDGGE